MTKPHIISYLNKNASGSLTRKSILSRPIKINANNGINEYFTLIFLV